MSGRSDHVAGYTADYVVVGAGLTGAVIARMLHDAGRSVVVLERRAHVAGNIHDHVHSSGIVVHTHGPHYFRTHSDALWQFMQRFTRFQPYVPELKSLVDGQLENWPIAASYLRRTVGADWQPAFTGVPANFEEAALALMPRVVYEKFVKGYTEKQWGQPARSLDASLARRFDVREDDDPRLMRHKYQGIPAGGYTRMVERILAGIPLRLNVDWLARRDAFQPRRRLIFTGPIDAFFGFDAGRLAYRGQRREHMYFPDVDFLQPCAQINLPDPASGPSIRRIEWKHMMSPAEAAATHGTVLTHETPFTPDDPADYEYPFPDATNAALYALYRQRADALPGVLVCGRLGEYRYYDMDQAILRAQSLALKLLADASDAVSA